MREVMITTIDNPYDPFTQFDEWYAYDTAMGYNTCGYLARVSATSPALSEEENLSELERVIDEIVELNIYGIHRKVVREI